MRHVYFSLQLMALAVAGCLGDGGNGLQPGDPGYGAHDMTPAPDVKALFKANIEPLLVGPPNTGSCGACHATPGGIGPGFMMAKPDVLTNLLSYPGLIGDTPETSRIYVKGQHEGPALTPEEKTAIHDWIVLWNMFKPAPTGVAKPAIRPFVPNLGANTIDLSTLDSMLAGQSITFNTKWIGAAILELSSIKINAAAMMGVHIKHPVWVIWDAKGNPTPDPIDSFATLDQTVFQSEAKLMGPGVLVLPYAQGQQLNVVFELIESKSGAADAGSSGPGAGGCKNVPGFSMVKNEFTGAAPINCSNCHANAGSNASIAFPMIGINNAANDAMVCASVRGEVDPVTPANSMIYKKLDPNSGLQHAGGKLNNPTDLTAFQTALNAWITTEK
jgi:hypothetical protein